ncbi:MAG: cytochrome c3 family protein [Planctomycetes bacterium]|nr:cytochrome c3 family protein [Planctomycetota bacterium]
MMKKVMVVMAATLAISLGACGLLKFLGLEKEPERPFSHLKHGKEQDLECQSCHTKAAKGAEAGMPVSLKKCMLCHEGIDEKQPPERKLAALYPGEKPAWSEVTKLPDEVIFSHKVHLDKKVGCAECHRGIEESASITEAVRVRKEACMGCHAERQASNECSTCHTAIRKERSPQSHGLSWKETHGKVVRLGMEDPPENRCSLCHTESTCTSCHRDEPPKNHTHFWRIQGHAVAVGVDRSSCATCHRTDFCDRCHQDTQPRTHTAAWGSPRNYHCLSCHTPLRSEGCALCHKSTPSHALAAPKPDWHTEGMNCRQCHVPGGSGPMPHPDKGDNCNACHP